jgi:small conductance mechanosensitive channel
VTHEPTRRLEVTVLVLYSEDVEKVKNVLMDIVNKNELVLKEPESTVFVNGFEPRGIDMGVRLWVEGKDYWDVKCELLESIKVALDQNEIQIPQ